MTTVVIVAFSLSALYMALNIFIIYTYNSGELIRAVVMTLPLALVLHTASVYLYVRGTEITANTPLISTITISSSMLCSVLFCYLYLGQKVNVLVVCGVFAILLGTTLVYLGGKQNV